MEGTFTQRVRQIYNKKCEEYPRNKANIFRTQRYLTQQLAHTGRITPLQRATYMSLFDELEKLSFTEMIAAVAQVSTRTIRRIMSEIKDDEVGEWTTTASILRALGVDQMEIWELSLLYIYERAQGIQKKTRITTQSPALSKEQEQPRTEPIGPLSRIRDEANSLV